MGENTPKGSTTPGVRVVLEPRPFQTLAVDGLRGAIRGGAGKLLLQAATGAGKTVMAAMVVQGAMAKGKSVLFLAHRRELVYQAREKLEDAGCPAGIIMAGELPLARHAQVASIQTLTARRAKEGLPPADVVVIDEAHRALSKSYRDTIAEYPEAVILGLTATPIRTDGRGLGDVFEAMVCCPTIGELTDQGYLVPARYFAPSEPDLEGVRTKAGDYVEGDLQERMDQPTLVGDVVEHWGKFAEGRPTIVFASGVQHSIHLTEQFQACGVTAAHVDGKTEKDVRERIWRDLSNGEIQVVCNCQVATEGLDVPAVSAVVLARPTKSAGLYLQMIGRGLRIHPGKADCLVIDHAGAVHQHGFADEFTEWKLDSGKGSSPNKTQTERVEKEARVIVCEECFASYTGKPTCPNCGHQHQTKGKGIAYVDGVLGEVKKSKEAPKTSYTPAQKMKWWSMLAYYAEMHGYKPGWAFHKYKEKFGVQPTAEYQRAPLTEPDLEVRGWIRSKQIAYAKRRAA